MVMAVLTIVGVGTDGSTVNVFHEIPQADGVWVHVSICIEKQNPILRSAGENILAK